ncbi:MAG: hypothetical protein LBP25_03825 [Tannerellaceae bacterium]|jgi:hypothetical protein|nr:hypothetical protein [Tannerellaceae bacterium]
MWNHLVPGAYEKDKDTFLGRFRGNLLRRMFGFRIIGADIGAIGIAGAQEMALKQRVSSASFSASLASLCDLRRSRIRDTAYPLYQVL